MSIVINSLTYIHPDGEPLFQNINLSIAKGDKISLVGDNGSGKSTFLRVLTGELAQLGGTITIPDTPYYIPQHLGQFDDMLISEALSIKEKLEALHAILNGDVAESNFDALKDDWEIEERVKTAMQYWNLEHLNLSAKMKTLSGGEKSKVFLAGIMIHCPQVVLLDEPSNHLDAKSRHVLYEWIKDTKCTVLVVSHDRELLKLFEKTLELSLKSIMVYGGNFEFYKEQKDAEVDSLQSQLDEKQRVLRQMQQKSQKLTEQRQKQESRGKVQKIKAGIPRIALGRLKDNAEQSSAKIKNEQAEKLAETSNELKTIKQQIESTLTLRIDIKNSGLHKGKLLVEAHSINPILGDRMLWENPLTFQIYSGDRIHIEGDNGSGKTSLMRIITGAMPIEEGEMYISDFNYLYIDQEYSMINNELSVFDQIQEFNKRELLEHELKMLLHHHQLSRDFWERQCASLSGGEKMKLLLCCIEVGDNAPDMLILDEPTNNLDVSSLNILTLAVRGFKGTVLLISHDRSFIEELNLTKIIALS